MILPIHIIFGGAFDPIHCGHLAIIESLKQTLLQHTTHILPCKSQVLKGPSVASAEQRVTMLHLALDQYPHIVIDTREIDRATPSYTADSLKEFRAEFSHAALGFVMGMDAFLQLPQWHQWQTLLTYAHLIVVNRPGNELPATHAMTDYYRVHHTPDISTLYTKPAGSIWLQQMPPQEISSTAIRQMIAQDQLTQAFIEKSLPPSVYRYIQQQHLYKPNKGS